MSISASTERGRKAAKHAAAVESASTISTSISVKSVWALGCVYMEEGAIFASLAEAKACVSTAVKMNVNCVVETIYAFMGGSNTVRAHPN
jgi:hypothetical protein